MPSKIAESLRPPSCEALSSAVRRASALPVRCPDGPRKPCRASEILEPALQRLARDVLHARVDRRLDSGAELEGRALAVLLGEKAPHPVDGFACHAARGAALPRQPDRLGRQLRRGGLGDDAGLGHAAEHVALPRLGRLGVLARRQTLRALRQAREQRRLGDVDVAHRLAEEVARCLLATVAAVAVVDLVQVEAQHLLLRELLRQLPRQDDLLHLAPHGALGREQERLHHLLRDRRPALRGAAAQHVLDERAHHAAIVDAVVVEELGVLGGDHRLDQDLRDLVVRDHRALLGAELADHRAVAVHDPRDLLRVIVAERLQRRQLRVAAVVREHADEPGDGDQRAEQAEAKGGAQRPEDTPTAARRAAASAAPRVAAQVFPRRRARRPTRGLARSARIAVFERWSGRHFDSLSVRRCHSRNPVR